MHGQVLIFSAIFGTVNLSVSILRLRFPILNFDAVLLCNEIFINKREIVICKIDKKKNQRFRSNSHMQVTANTSVVK